MASPTRPQHSRRFNVFSVAIFTVEYILRLWTAVEVPFLRRDPPWKARLRMAATPALIIDLLAILPFYLQSLLGLDLRILRVLRLLRFLKLSRYSPAMHTLMRVLANERRSLLGASFLLATALLFASSGIYLIERATPTGQVRQHPRQRLVAVATLTTVGYGDITPITPLGASSAASSWWRGYASSHYPSRLSRPASHKRRAAAISSSTGR